MISSALGSPAAAAAHSSAKLSWMAGPVTASRGPSRTPASTARATSTWGMLVDSTHPRIPQSHSAPSGSTMMCPISPAFPEVPRTTSSFSTIPQPIPVPIYIKTKLPAPLGPPAQVLGHGGTGHVLVHDGGQPGGRGQGVAERHPVPAQQERRVHNRALLKVDRTGRGDPQAGDLRMGQRRNPQ